MIIIKSTRRQPVNFLFGIIFMILSVVYSGCAPTTETPESMGKGESVLRTGLAMLSDPDVTSKADAVEAFKQACDLGNNYGCHKVGATYNNGLYGKDKNYELAKQWYEKAAKKGYVPSQLNIANLYAYRLLPLDDETGYRWLVKAEEGLRTCLPGSIETESSTPETERQRLCRLAKNSYLEILALFRKRMTGEEMVKIRTLVLQSK